MKVILTLWVYAAVAVGMLLTTGCAGVELGGRLGLYRVDERADSSATVQAQTKPLKCYFVNCTEGESRGS